MAAHEDVVGAYLAGLERMIADGDLEQALKDIRDLSWHVTGSPVALGRVISSPELDRICQRIGALTWPAAGAPRAADADDDDSVTYLVSELYNSGGHTRLLEDMIKLQPSRVHRVLMTNIFDRPPETIVPDFIDAIADEIDIAPRGPMLEKLAWLQQQLAARRSRAVFLLNHMHDAVSIAAPQPGSGKYIFIHQVDHRFCLGVHVPHFKHVDLSPIRFYACREQMDIRANEYWTCSFPDEGVRAPASFAFPAQPLTTACSGSAVKFAGIYPFSYFEEIPGILKCTGGTHLHIGPIPEEALRELRNAISARGVDPARFIHVPWVRSVWQAMSQYKVDIYLSSFPVFGGRALLEAMASGTPVLVHRHIFNPLISDLQHVYPGAMVWTRPRDLYALLESITTEELRHHAQEGRRWYETNYGPELFPECLERLSSSVLPALPAESYVDPLAALLTPGQLGVRVEQQLKFATHLEERGYSKEAAACRAEVLQLDGLLAAALGETARQQIQDGDIAGGLRSLLRAAAIRPDSEVFQNNVGCLLLQTGEVDRAIGHFRQALALNPKFGEAQKNLDHLLKTHGRMP